MKVNSVTSGMEEELLDHVKNARTSANVTKSQ